MQMLRCCLLLLVSVHSIGCVALEDLRYHHSKRMLARRAWSQMRHELGPVPVDYADGWRLAYYDMATGANGALPAVAPEKYWSTRYQNPAGRAAIEAFYAGYQDGVLAAEQDGTAFWNGVPTSGVAALAACDMADSVAPIERIEELLPLPPHPAENADQLLSGSGIDQSASAIEPTDTPRVAPPLDRSPLQQPNLSDPETFTVTPPVRFAAATIAAEAGVPEPPTPLSASEPAGRAPRKIVALGTQPHSPARGPARDEANQRFNSAILAKQTDAPQREQTPAKPELKVATPGINRRSSYGTPQPRSLMIEADLSAPADATPKAASRPQRSPQHSVAKPTRSHAVPAAAKGAGPRAHTSEGERPSLQAWLEKYHLAGGADSASPCTRCHDQESDGGDANGRLDSEAEASEVSGEQGEAEAQIERDESSSLSAK